MKINSIDILRRMELETDLEVFEHEKSRQEHAVSTYRRALDIKESELKTLMQNEKEEKIEKATPSQKKKKKRKRRSL